MLAIGKRKQCCTIECSTNLRYEFAWKRWDSSTSLGSTTTKRWWRLPQRSAGNSPSRDTNRSKIEQHPPFNSGSSICFASDVRKSHLPKPKLQAIPKLTRLSGERTRLACQFRRLAEMLSHSIKESCWRGANDGTRGACAPQTLNRALQKLSGALEFGVSLGFGSWVLGFHRRVR